MAAHSANFLPDGSMLKERLVDQGWAWHYTRYSKKLRLARLEEGARRTRRGLWAHGNRSAREFRQTPRVTHRREVRMREFALKSVCSCFGVAPRKAHGKRR